MPLEAIVLFHVAGLSGDCYDIIQLFVLYLILTIATVYPFKNVLELANSYCYTAFRDRIALVQGHWAYNISSGS